MSSAWRFLLFCGWLSLLLGCGQQASVQLHGRDAVPDRLSDWQLFSLSTQHLQLSEGVQPYELNSALFTDYAHKLRTVWLPEGTQAAYTANDTLDFPVGTIISKTFYYPRASAGGFASVRLEPDTAQYVSNGRLDLTKVRLMETRLLIHHADGWQALPYVWNDEQTEAFLEITGAMSTLHLVDDMAESASEFAYIVPDKNQCSGCHVTNHASKAIQPIGPAARHLNRPSKHVAGKNQLQAWADMAYLTGLPVIDEVARSADWKDEQQSLDARARAYLDINCAHCHNPAGAADTSALLFNVGNLDPLMLGTCKPPVAAGRGTGNRRYTIVPGKAEDSIITYRMASLRPGDKMPELGRSLAHTEGVALIAQWINELDGDC